MNKIGCCYHPKLDDARRVAEELRALAAEHVAETWIASTWDEAARAQIPATDLLICVGGDGTVLRAAREVVPHPTLILGVNMGRLGFLTELDAAAAIERLPDVIAGGGRTEERAMLHAQIVSDGDHAGAVRHDALNDVVIGRSTIGRTVQVAVRVDGAHLADFRADGVIVATATGSTAYSLSVGGPVLSPESRELLLTPLAPHLAPRNSVVLPPTASVEVQLAPHQPVSVSIDGERDLDLHGEEIIRVTLSPHSARFLRLGPPTAFYERVGHGLSWLRGGEGERPGWPGWSLLHDEDAP
jgi:NAD+ kinase